VEPQRVGAALALLFAGGCSDADTTSPAAVPGADPFCSTRPKLTFCEDFDAAALPGAFDTREGDAAALTLVEDVAASAPRSLRVSVEAGEGAALSRAFDAGERLRLFAQLRLEAFGDGEVELGSFSVGDYRIGVGASSDGSFWAVEQHGVDGTRTTGEGTLPLGVWASVRWDVNLHADGTGTALLRFGNDTILESDALTPPPQTSGGSPEARPVASIGLTHATGSWAAGFDNVTVEIED
jgi:hypothetical protein